MSDGEVLKKLRFAEIPQTTLRWPQYLAGFGASLGAFASGTGLGWSAPATPRLVNEQQYFPITQVQMDLASSVLTIGLALSCLPVGYLMNTFGRKWTMIGSVLPYMIGWSLLIWAQNFSMLLIGRFFLGLAGGAFCVSAPQYSAEITEKEIRGIVGTFFQLLIIAGILFVYIIGANTTVYRMNIICSIFPLIFGFFFFFMPESPVYLVAKNRIDEAEEAIKWLRGDHYDPYMEIEQLKSELYGKVDNIKPSYKEVFSRRATKQSIIIIFGVKIFQQTSGISIVIFYTTSIFIAAGTSLSSDISTIIIGAIHLAATFVGSMLVDRVGRRLLLLISISVMSVTLVTLGMFFYIQKKDPAYASMIGWLPVTSLGIYIIAFALGFGPIPWLLVSELYSKDVNSIMSSITGAMNPCLTFIVASSFGTVSAAIGIGETFWIFAAFSIVGTIFVYMKVPETKGRSLMDIQRMLGGEKLLDSH